LNDKIVFFSSMCLLDNTSGAAISVRSFLEAAAASGLECESFTASLFDPQREVNLAEILGPNAADSSAKGKRCLIKRNGVNHSVFIAKSSLSRNFTLEEQRMFEGRWVAWLKENRPKVVMTYGGSPYTVRLQEHARRMGAQIVFYLGNAEYRNADFHVPGDILLCPSHFLSQHYREKFGIEPRVLRTIMKKERLDLDTLDDSAALHHRWRTGFVTFMTPIPHKGLTLFSTLAKVAATRRPNLKFLVTEGRSNREWLVENGYDLTHRPNVWFMASHEDVRSILERTKILLVPSYWKEGFARSVLESQLCGIPVLSSSQGGLPEALNGGGYVFDIPESLLANHMNRPDKKTTLQWWDTLEKLVDDEEHYIEASFRAREASRPFHPDVTADNAVAFFRQLLA
jgi:glycosyltransferase involved in cell wall biosynthesis